MMRLLKAFEGRWRRSLQSLTHPVTYDAILFKRFTFTSSHTHQINHVWQNVFKKEGMSVNSEAMRIGNREGLDWMERFDRLEKDSMAQKKINNQLLKASSEQKKINDQQKRRWFELRATEIEKNGRSKAKVSKSFRNERNEVVHGANIIEDLEVVNFMEPKSAQDRYDLRAVVAKERYDSLRESFEVWYGVSLRYEEEIIKAPKLVIDTFNLFADTTSLRSWSKYSTARRKARKVLRGSNRMWLKHVDNPTKFEYPEDHLWRGFEKAVSIKPAKG